MKFLIRTILIVGVVYFLSASLFAEETSEPNSVKAFVIPCRGMIDDGLFESIKRRTQQAIDSGGDYLIYEISTYGGLVKAADEISKYLIHNASQNARTVAYIKTEAISAGAMISVSCEDIIMRENTTIGDSAPITMGGKLEGVEREKAESFIRSVFDRAAQANGYPQALLRAMVSMGISVYRVENIKTGAYEYFQEQDLPDDANSFDIENKELVINDEQILTLTSADAFKYDISSQTVDDIEAALEFISERDNVRFSGLPKVLEPSWSEQMVRWINSPAVMGVLVMLAMLGVYMELSSPGLGLPGLVALICVVVIIGSKYLIDLANWIEIALFFTGVLLLFIELFVIPGFGVAGLSGILCVLAGIFGMMIKNRPDELPSLDNPFDWQIFMNSALGLGIGIFGFFILAWVFLKSIPKIKFLNGLSLEPPGIKMGASAGEAVSISAPTGTKPHNLQAGMKGKAIYNLHPTGKAEFENAIVDVVAQGEFIDKGVEVEITEIHGNRVVVKPVVEKG